MDLPAQNSEICLPIPQEEGISQHVAAPALIEDWSVGAQVSIYKKGPKSLRMVLFPKMVQQLD